MQRRRVGTSAIGLALVLSGCMTVPRGTALSRPAPFPTPIQRRAWIAAAEISDAAVPDRTALEQSLTLSLEDYITGGGFFRSASVLPGSVEPEDLVLRFRFDRYEQRRSPHPAYFPLALATLTLYIWFGGPIYSDSSDLSGQLEIQDGKGRVLGTVQSKVSESHAVSFWSSEYALPSGIGARTALVRDLLDRGVEKVRQQGGHA